MYEMNTSRGMFRGKTIESITRREFGREAEVRRSQDRNNPTYGMVVCWSELGGAYEVLAEIYSVFRTLGPRELAALPDSVARVWQALQDGLTDPTEADAAAVLSAPSGALTEAADHAGLTSDQLAEVRRRLPWPHPSLRGELATLDLGEYPATAAEPLTSPPDNDTDLSATTPPSAGL
jgi:hypothetical protein